MNEKLLPFLNHKTLFYIP